jgi:hypothetical protein
MQPRDSKLAGGMLVAAGVVFAHDVASWGIGKGLDTVADAFKPGELSAMIPSPFPWWDALGLALMALGFGFLARGFWQKRRATHVGSVTAFPAGLYVGAMNVDASHLGSEFYLTIAVLGFNATGVPISISVTSGAIAAGEVTDEHPTTQVELPPAAIMHDRTSTNNIANLNEFLVVLYQRVLRPDAERLAALLINGGRIDLYFGRLDVIAHAVDDQSKSARLPIWAGACLRRVPDRILTDKPAMGSANIVIGAPQLG